MRVSSLAIFVFAATLGSLAPRLRADEGLWRFDHPPFDQMEATYGFKPSADWLAHVQGSIMELGLRSSSRFFGWGTGSFVSADGLVLTNQHVCLSSLIDAAKQKPDLVKEGFLAGKREEEIALPGLEAHFRLGSGNPVIFKDVRLVMVPKGVEVTSPGKNDAPALRPHLDFCLLRVYENGAPYHPSQHLDWSRTGLSTGDWSFTAGYPGTSYRNVPVAFADFISSLHAHSLGALSNRLRAVFEYSEESEEHAKQTEELKAELTSRLQSVENAKFHYTLYRSQALALEDQDAGLRALVHANPDLLNRFGGAWDDMESEIKSLNELMAVNQALHDEERNLLRGPLEQAVKIVRVIRETMKSPASRSNGYRDADLEEKRKACLDPKPWNRELETALLAFGLEDAESSIGSANSYLKRILDGRSTSEAAKAAIEQSRLDEPAFVAELLKGGPKALDRCKDPLLRMAQMVDLWDRDFEEEWSNHFMAASRDCSLIYEAQIAVHANTLYMSSDGTLRFSYGQLRPVDEKKDFVTLGDYPEKAWPSRWTDRGMVVDKELPINMFLTNDALPGNSGSPIVNREGALVGVLFASTFSPYAYTQNGHSTGVDARAILWLLDKVYDAQALVQELRPPKQ
jgi:hypothetical protein